MKVIGTLVMALALLGLAGCRAPAGPGATPGAVETVREEPWPESATRTPGAPTDTPLPLTDTPLPPSAAPRAEVTPPPGDAQAHLDPGLAYAAKNDFDRAIADFDRAIQLKPDLANPYYGRGLAYKMKGEREKAIADFKKFLTPSTDAYWRKQAEEQLKALRAK